MDRSVTSWSDDREQLDVVELSTTEMVETDGGILILAMAAGAAVVYGADWLDRNGYL